jgi:hypothetical protein
VVIVLDWEKPWDWLRQLEEWIQMLKETLEKEIGKDGYEATEAKERGKFTPYYTLLRINSKI